MRSTSPTDEATTSRACHRRLTRGLCSNEATSAPDAIPRSSERWRSCGGRHHKRWRIGSPPVGAQLGVTGLGGAQMHPPAPRSEAVLAAGDLLRQLGHFDRVEVRARTVAHALPERHASRHRKRTSFTRSRCRCAGVRRSVSAGDRRRRGEPGIRRAGRTGSAQTTAQPARLRHPWSSGRVQARPPPQPRGPARRGRQRQRTHP